jgi:hypothetical protein
MGRERKGGEKAGGGRVRFRRVATQMYFGPEALQQGAVERWSDKRREKTILLFWRWACYTYRIVKTAIA